MEVINEIFDPEGTEYDMESALKYGLKPDETGHWATRVPQTGLILKGMDHHTIDKSKTEDERLGYKWIKKDGRYYSIKQNMEPIPFDIELYVNKYNNEQPKEKVAENRSAFAKTFDFFADPFIKQGYVASAAVNRGIAGFSVHLDNIAGFIEESTGMESSGLFERVAQIYEDNAEYWQKRVDEAGVGFIDEIMGEAIGGFAPGVSQFVLDVASGLTLPYMDGAYQAYEKGENPFMGGMVEAAKTGLLAGIFRMIHPLKQYLRAPTMGTVFGIQEAEVAPEGEKIKAFAKGMGIGAVYSMSSPGGRMGLNEVLENAKPAIREFQRKMAEEAGMVEIRRPTPKAKEPYEMTKEEFKGLTSAKVGWTAEIRAREHIKEIQQAIKEGKTIPPEVLRDYPDLGKVEPKITLKVEPIPEIKVKEPVEPPIPTPEVRPKRQRQFLKTLDESADIDPSLKPRIEEIEPRDYFVKPNKESFETARKMVEKDPDAAEAFAKKDTPPTAEKGAVLHELVKKYQSERNFDKAIEIIEEFDRQGRAAGQFIQTAAQWSKLLSPEGFIKWANKQLENVSKKYTWADTLLRRKPEEFKLSREEEKIVLEKYREMADMEKDIDRADATLELIDMVAAKVPPSVSELLDAYRYQNMLSSPKTQQRNIGYNQEAVFIARPWDLTTRAAIDYVKCGFTGKERKTYINDVPVYMKTVINSVPNAIMAFKETMKLSKGATLEKPDIGIESKTALEQARARQIPLPLTLVMRFMEACDKFNMALMGAAEMAINKKNGMSDSAAHSRAVETSKEYLLRAEVDPRDPRYSIPSKALASLYQMMMATRKLPIIGTLSKWYVPFLRTPINLGINMIEYSPLGLIRMSANAETAAKMLSGGIITALGATVAYLGETAWAPPSNEKEKALFYSSGRKPYSIKMGNKWIPIWYLGPYALAFGVPMAVKHYTQDTTSSMSKDASEKIFDIAEGLARFVGSQSSTQSIGALFSALDGDIDYKLSSQTGFTVSQIIPGASLVRHINTMIDPAYRHPHGFIEGLEANLPILSKGLDARMTPLFEEALREPINYFLPYDIGTLKEPYESLYYLEQFKIIDANGVKLDKLTDRMRKNPMSIEKSLKEYMKIISKGPEIKIKE